MPLYEFVCKKCKHEFDEVCSYDDIGKVKCSKCKGKAEKKLSVPAIAFKGSGFYRRIAILVLVIQRVRML